MPGKQKNEGEGNRTAARAYNKASERFAKSGRVSGQAERAKRAVESREKLELEEAERVGKSKARDEDPAIKRKPARH
jgi:hypothetical protein